jgi:hypothetical protein
MDRRMANDLDRFITGNYGEDQFKNSETEEDEMSDERLSKFNSPGSLMSKTLPVLKEGGIADPIPGYEGWEEKSNLGFVVEFTNPGEMFVAIYIGMEENIGPNNSRMYHFLSGDGIKFQMWGSTITDGKMDAMEPKKGCEMLVMYCGDVPTKRGASPAKDFRILVNKEK